MKFGGNLVVDLDSAYFNDQIITYIGNKRSLLKEINPILLNISKKLGNKKLKTVDLFSGSGIVARLLKQYSEIVVANDLEKYSQLINSVYLSNKSEFDQAIFNKYLNILNDKVNTNLMSGIISKLYAPNDDLNIKIGERVFYTRENAMLIDTYRHYIEEIIPKNMQKYFFASLITEASIHVNTSGVFKGFYKDKKTGIGKFGGTAENALSRIKGKISIKEPILSNINSKYEVYNEDAVELSQKLKDFDLVYLDPPYNQHPYGSNYFMLNLILDNKMPDKTSRVSGIPENWNRSVFNKKNEALEAMEKIISTLDSKYILISYNNEGFIKYEDMVEMLNKYGVVKVKNILYNTFRGCRNLNKRELHTHEYLFLLERC